MFAGEIDPGSLCYAIYQYEYYLASNAEYVCNNLITLLYN